MERFDLLGTPFATQAEAEAGLNNETLMTPLRTKQAIQKNAPVQSVNGQTGEVNVDSLPVGTSIMYMGNNVPDGYLAENGAAVSRATYAKLFAAIGTTYGAGDGSTTFNLPNKNNGSFAEGSNTAGTVKSAGLPNANGYTNTIVFGDAGNWDTGSGIKEEQWHGAFLNTKWNSAYQRSNGDNSNGTLIRGQLNLSLSKSNAIYGNSDTVQPKSVTVKFCIKY